MSDIVINKVQSIQRCVERAREEYHADPAGFATNFTRQDAAVLNVLRACEQAIDLANHVIKTRKMGIPASSAQSFELLEQKSVIDPTLSGNLIKMIHFRNTVIHQYQRMDMQIVQKVITAGLDDLIRFGDCILKSTS
ncbi:MAG: DUF86 domain-containing protein [Desulfobacteraceae bacterium]|jgi:uncharacterized protein YutE (UPF0331/DUF86 family)